MDKYCVSILRVYFLLASRAHARTHAFGSKKIGYLYSLAPAAQKSAIKLGLSDVYLHETKESSKKSVALSERDINLVRIIINALFQNQFDKC